MMNVRHTFLRIAVLAAIIALASTAAATTVTYAQNSLLPLEVGGNGAIRYQGTRDGHLREYAVENNQGNESFLVIGQYDDNEGDDTRLFIDFDEYGDLP